MDVGFDEGEGEELVAGGVVFESVGGVICATDPRCDHQYQPPNPSPPKNSRKNRPRIAPCHHRNWKGAEEVRSLAVSEPLFLEPRLAVESGLGRRLWSPQIDQELSTTPEVWPSQIAADP